VRPLLALAAASVALAGCGGTTTTTTTAAAAAKPSAPASSSAPRDRFGTVWLCRPGVAANPCLSGLAATAVLPGGATRIDRAAAQRNPPIDCFYVYPTISGEPTVNADLAIGFREREVAIAQAARFSLACRVYAPVYRQITLAALAHPARITLTDALLAYDSVRSAFRDYLAHYNHGRGIVFIGHSQGATILTRLLRQEVDRSPALRRHLVSALLLGGNVTVSRTGTGGDFTHIPPCRSSRQTGCVVAYSSFTGTPPANSQFGRTTSDAGVSLLSPRHLSPAVRILCVNPAAPGGGTGALQPYLPSLVLSFVPGAAHVSTPWVTFPNEYSARCRTAGDATWLQVTRIAGPADHRPALTRLGESVLGLHVLDVNIALGNLVTLVRDQARKYLRG
jgi:hypothetical protein